MSGVVTNNTMVGHSFGEMNNNAQKSIFDLGAFVGDLSFEEDASSDEVSLEGLQQELEECTNDDVVTNILSKGTKLREYTKGVENNLRQVELDSIQDYIKESDNLVSLHDQIRDCDNILSQMEALLSGFQGEIGSISSDIKILQEKSMDMGLKLKNRKVAESKLAKFVEDIIVPPRMVDIIVDGEVNEEYMKTLELLSKKLKFVEADTMVKSSKALVDVQPELEKLRQKAVSKIYDFIVQKLYALRKPKTNIQILQQSVLLKYKYAVSFLKEHGKEVYMEVRSAYIDTMNKVLSAHFRAYIQALEKLQLDISTSSDLIGVDTRSTSLFSRAREALKNRSAVFALGERLNVLKEIDQPALIPHIAEASSLKYPYEVLFRSLQKLLMDTASSEYLFCDDFFAEQSIFYEIISGPLAVIDEHFASILPNCYDAIGLRLMICIIHQHRLTMSRRRIPCLDSFLDKVNISLWPRFKMVFDMHLSSLRNANVKTLWEDDVHPHYVMRRYAEFTASLIHINADYGDGQPDLNLERLRMAADDLIIKLAKTFPKPKAQTVFLINNYDMTISVLKATKKLVSQVPLTSTEEFKAAVFSAKRAFPSWRAKTLLARQMIMFKLQELIRRDIDKLSLCIVSEHGKTLKDAYDEVYRGLDAVDHACGLASLQMGEFFSNVPNGTDTYSIREPLGVCAGICPFSFPAMISLWMFPFAITCGNTFILKPSEKAPRASLMLAELLREAGLPNGVLNIVHGTYDIVDNICDDESIKAISFVGSNMDGMYIYERASRKGKRVQCNTGARNHAVVMPDANIDATINALVAAGFGAAGQKCVGLCTVVFVAGSESWEHGLVECSKSLRLNAGTEPDADLGPVNSKHMKERIYKFIESSVENGAKLLLDGRDKMVPGYEKGDFIGPTILSDITNDMACYQADNVGPVLLCLKANSLEEAINIVNGNKHPCGASIFTTSGIAARKFQNEITAVQIGLNVCLPNPLPFFSVTGPNASFTGDLSFFGKANVHFYTQMKMVTQQWGDSDRDGEVQLLMPNPEIS